MMPIAALNLYALCLLTAAVMGEYTSLGRRVAAQISGLPWIFAEILGFGLFLFLGVVMATNVLAHWNQASRRNNAASSSSRPLPRPLLLHANPEAEENPEEDQDQVRGSPQPGVFIHPKKRRHHYKKKRRGHDGENPFMPRANRGEYRPNDRDEYHHAPRMKGEPRKGRAHPFAERGPAKAREPWEDEERSSDAEEEEYYSEASYYSDDEVPRRRRPVAEGSHKRNPRKRKMARRAGGAYFLKGRNDEQEASESENQLETPASDRVKVRNHSSVQPSNTTATHPPNHATQASSDLKKIAKPLRMSRKAPNVLTAQENPESQLQTPSRSSPKASSKEKPTRDQSLLAIAKRLPSAPNRQQTKTEENQRLSEKALLDEEPSSKDLSEEPNGASRRKSSNIPSPNSVDGGSDRAPANLAVDRRLLKAKPSLPNNGKEGAPLRTQPTLPQETPKRSSSSKSKGLSTKKPPPPPPSEQSLDIPASSSSPSEEMVSQRVPSSAKESPLPKPGLAMTRLKAPVQLMGRQAHSDPVLEISSQSENAAEQTKPFSKDESTVVDGTENPDLDVLSPQHAADSESIGHKDDRTAGALHLYKGPYEQRKEEKAKGPKNPRLNPPERVHKKRPGSDKAGRKLARKNEKGETDTIGFVSPYIYDFLEVFNILPYNPPPPPRRRAGPRAVYKKITREEKNRQTRGLRGLANQSSEEEMEDRLRHVSGPVREKPIGSKMGSSGEAKDGYPEFRVNLKSLAARREEQKRKPRRIKRRPVIKELYVQEKKRRGSERERSVAGASSSQAA